MLRKQLLLLGFLASAGLLVGCGEAQDEEERVTELNTLEEKVNYIFGMNLAENFAEGGVQIEPDAFALALRDMRDGVEPRLSEEEITQVMRTFQEQEMARRQAEHSAVAETNLAEARAFLASNAEEEGVEVTESGLQYRVLEEGEGPQPQADDTVTVHYRGQLLDGTVFDSSYERDQPATFSLTGVIAGWTEGLQLMREGGRMELYIPPDLAYGSSGNGPIPPNAALIFEVELLEVETSGDE
ncbi:FKBP-type peptidyl-prolyl cis-trans isomerase [Marinimicrobium sp. ABcell2]|uniref:FKBP-type peptidyl-prolyl cis-trans isomerase n=1 Tax=Marinimicrobium sp. ABcell2 TaxID=3069751 RepID=UPI0027B31861|nr:FKBP-type peptidyl-prolyl cis-trans isomerase [Marinimicrobium sp. ABcell2]MDQ2076120.1 FKBP-type peptidyl-prolyl cis-trans isomerase [Marinimicrobium sp. ABcell2]